MAMVRGPEVWVDALPAGDFRECARYCRENPIFGGFDDQNARTQVVTFAGGRTDYSVSAGVGMGVRTPRLGATRKSRN